MCELCFSINYCLLHTFSAVRTTFFPLWRLGFGSGNDTKDREWVSLQGVWERERETRLWWRGVQWCACVVWTSMPLIREKFRKPPYRSSSVQGEWTLAGRVGKPRCLSKEQLVTHTASASRDLSVYVSFRALSVSIVCQRSYCVAGLHSACKVCGCVSASFYNVMYTWSL